MNKKLIWYHGCSEEKLKQIKSEGILFGKRDCVYLASDIEEAIKYGDIILQVFYDTTVNPEYNNCPPDFDCFQIRVYEPISLDNIIINKVPKKWRDNIDYTASRQILNVGLKQLKNGEWNSYTTYKSDIAFVNKDIEFVKNKMIEFFDLNFNNIIIKFDEPRYYLEKSSNNEIKLKHGFSKNSKLDHI